MMNNKIVGAIGETMAQKFLKKKGYKIVEKNFNTPLGEIDIIARIKDLIVFVEVKDRSTKKFGLPREAVTPNKQQKIKTVALLWLKKNNLFESKVRFDVVEIIGEIVNHIENAF